MRAHLLLAGPLLGACSFVAVKPPPSGGYERIEDIDCTESVGAPVVDTIMAPTFAALAVGVFVAASDEGDLHQSEGPDLGAVATIGGVGLVAAAVSNASSAVYGYITTAECRTEVARWESREDAKAPGDDLAGTSGGEAATPAQEPLPEPVDRPVEESPAEDPVEDTPES